MFKTSLRLSLNPWIESYCFYDWSPSILVTSPEAQDCPRRDLTFKKRKFSSPSISSASPSSLFSLWWPLQYNFFSFHLFLFHGDKSVQSFSFHGNHSNGSFQKSFDIFCYKLVILWKERLIKRLNAIHSISRALFVGQIFKIIFWNV